MKLKIYVASSWRNQSQPNTVIGLRACGYEVYDFREPKPDETGFSWKTIDPNWEEWNTAQWREALKTPIAKAGYKNDRDGMDWADVCVLLLPCGRSAHLEAGFMAGQGKPVFTLACETVEADLMNLLLGPAENLCATFPELLEALFPLRDVRDRIGGTE